MTCHAGDTLAGDRLAHLLCRSLMMRLSSPSPAMAVPWGSAKAGAVRRGARLVLTWHPQTLSPKERVCPPTTTTLELPAVEVRGGGLRHSLFLPMSPHYMGYGIGKGAPSCTPLVVHVPVPKCLWALPTGGAQPLPPFPGGVLGLNLPFPTQCVPVLVPVPIPQDSGCGFGTGEALPLLLLSLPLLTP